MVKKNLLNAKFVKIDNYEEVEFNNGITLKLNIEVCDDEQIDEIRDNIQNDLEVQRYIFNMYIENDPNAKSKFQNSEYQMDDMLDCFFSDVEVDVGDLHLDEISLWNFGYIF